VFRFDPKIFIWPLSKTGPTRAECSKNIALCDEKCKTALLQLSIATHAELLGVSRENLTLHNEIYWRNTKIVMAIKEKYEL